MWILPKNYPLSSHYVADMVASSEDLSLLDTIIDSSLFVRSKPMSKSSLLRKWKRDTWFQRLCGQILKPSQHRSFETKLMSYLQVIPANRSAKLGNGGGKMIHDTCGPTSRNTSEQLDLFGVSSRTCKDTSRWDSPQSSQIWKNWVIEQRGEYSQRKKLALRIKEKECLSWPTPTAHLSKEGGYPAEMTRNTVSLTTLAMGNGQTIQDKTSMNGKNQELSNWPTPTAVEGTKIGNKANYGQKGLSNHPSIVGPVTREKKIKSGKEKNWATPLSRDYKGSCSPEALVRKDGKSRMDGLPQQAQYDETNISKTGKLNPNWCEQLMGLPVGWTKIDDADDRISRLMAIGNGVVPQTAALAWVTLSEKIKQ